MERGVKRATRLVDSPIRCSLVIRPASENSLLPESPPARMNGRMDVSVRRDHRPRAVLFLAVLLGAGCGGESMAVDPPGPLVSVDEWALVPSSEDPFWTSTSSDTVICGPEHWRSEVNGVEVTTLECDYITLRQLTQRSTTDGQPLELEVWWQSLTGAEVVIGRFAVWVGDWPLYDVNVVVPGPGAARLIQATSRGRIPSGTPVYFHVKNHGVNTWTLSSLISE